MAGISFNYSRMKENPDLFPMVCVMTGETEGVTLYRMRLQKSETASGTKSTTYLDIGLPFSPGAIAERERQARRRRAIGIPSAIGFLAGLYIFLRSDKDFGLTGANPVQKYGGLALAALGAIGLAANWFLRKRTPNVKLLSMLRPKLAGPSELDGGRVTLDIPSPEAARAIQKHIDSKALGAAGSRLRKAGEKKKRENPEPDREDEIEEVEPLDENAAGNPAGTDQPSG
jgi:hypothetical protein